MSEVRKAVYGLAIFSILIVTMFSVYQDFAKIGGVSITDESTLGRATELQKLIDDSKTDADGVKEEDVGGFSIIRGPLSYFKTMFGIGNLITGLVGDLAIIFHLPSFITNNINVIITTMFLATMIAYIWARKPT